MLKVEWTLLLLLLENGRNLLLAILLTYSVTLIQYGHLNCRLNWMNQSAAWLSMLYIKKRGTAPSHRWLYHCAIASLSPACSTENGHNVETRSLYSLLPCRWYQRTPEKRTTERNREKKLWTHCKTHICNITINRLFTRRCFNAHYQTLGTIRPSRRLPFTQKQTSVSLLALAVVLPKLPKQLFIIHALAYF